MDRQNIYPAIVIKVDRSSKPPVAQASLLATLSAKLLPMDVIVVPFGASAQVRMHVPRAGVLFVPQFDFMPWYYRTYIAFRNCCQRHNVAPIVISATVDRFLSEKIFAVIRLSDTSSLPAFVERMVEGGITIIEVTLNSGNALGAIETLVAKFPQCLIGAGTVIGRRDSENAIAAGAKFLVSPVMDGKMISICRDNGIPSFAGAFTPTEVHQAQSMGADFVKIFPLAGIGPNYIKALRGPLPDVKYVATNGVTLDTLGEFFAAGCSLVGLGTPLISNEDIVEMRLDAVGERVKRIIEIKNGLLSTK